MRRIVVLLALLAASLAAAAEAASLADVRALLDRGERAEARAALDDLLARGGLPDETRDEAELLRADLEEDGETREASLRALLDRRGSPGRAARLHLALGHVHFARGETALALEQFRGAREKGRAEEGGLWEGICALALGDAPAARESLELAAASGNASMRQRALLALGDSHRLSGDPEAAIEVYQRIIDDAVTGPGWSATALLRAAECAHALRREDTARDYLARLIATAPASYDAPAARELLRTLAPPEEEPIPEPLPAETTAPDTAAAAAAPVAAAPEAQVMPVAPPPAAAFAVQIGAFGSEENAVALAAAARERTARRVRIVDGEDGLHRIVVGRFREHDLAAAFGDSLGAVLGATATVVPSPED